MHFDLLLARNAEARRRRGLVGATEEPLKETGGYRVCEEESRSAAQRSGPASRQKGGLAAGLRSCSRLQISKRSEHGLLYRNYAAAAPGRQPFSARESLQDVKEGHKAQ